jgi:tetratricopeptide (TPR) repeat protein
VAKRSTITTFTWPANGPLRNLLEYYRKIHEDNGQKSYRDIAKGMHVGHVRVRSILIGESAPVDLEQAKQLAKALGGGEDEVRTVTELFRSHDADATQPQSEPRRRPGPRRRAPSSFTFAVPSKSQFVGRIQELKVLDEQLIRGPRLVAVEGIGGSGKTWLAARWASQNSTKFPDGLFYIDLRGFDPIAEPLTQPSVMHYVLSAAGIQSDDIPLRLEQQAELYMKIITERRILLILDNAKDADHVAQLVPPVGHCSIIVTSRSEMADLTIPYGATRVVLDGLSESDSLTLISRLIGVRKVRADKGAATELAHLCSGLPLAITILASRMTTEPGANLSEIVEDVRMFPLDTLEQGRGAASLRSVFNASYSKLASDEAQLFKIFSLTVGTSTGLFAVAALMGWTARDARRVLRALEGGHLVLRIGQNRYQMHDIVKSYAHEILLDTDDLDATQPLLRLSQFMVLSAFNADRKLEPHRLTIAVRYGTGVPPSDPTDASTALHWFADEYETLFPLALLASRNGWHQIAWEIFWTLNTYMWRKGYLRDSRLAWSIAVESAEVWGNAGALSLAHRLLGLAHARLHEYETAEKHMNEALSIAVVSGDIARQANGHQALSWLWAYREDNAKALAHARRSLALARKLGNEIWVAEALSSTGWYLAQLTRYDEALKYCLEASTIYEDVKDPDGKAANFETMGFIATGLGHLAEAMEWYENCLGIFRDIENRFHEADLLERIGDLHEAMNRSQAAREIWEEARKIYDEQDRATEADRTVAKMRDCSH